ncbi:MAG TPA: DASS family sodium-coupled anion symporter [Spirochaetia bacterium]|nr:DASS family sodium-coupled anion symporter [Spirochaetia bacterium]
MNNVVVLKQGTKKSLLWIGIAVLAAVVILLIPNSGKLPPAGQRFLSLLVMIMILWVSEAVPIGITALLAGGGLILFGVQNPSGAWMPFSNASVMYVLMLIMFGVIIEQVGLAKRILNLILKKAGTRVKRLSLLLALASTLMATIFHDATVTIIMLFSIIPIFRAMNITPDKSTRLSRFFTLLIPLSASAGGFGTYLGGGRNPITVEILQKMTGIEIGFAQFMLYNLPITLFTGFTTWAVLWLIYKPEAEEVPKGLVTEKLPPMNPNEKLVLYLFLAAFALWTFTDLTGIQVSIVAAAVLVPIFALKLVDWKESVQKFPWESWLVFGAGVSLGNSMLESGAGKWLADLILPAFVGGPWPLLFFGCGILGSMLTSMMSNTAAAALLLPITIPLATSMGLDPAPLAMGAPITCSFIMLVIGCPPTIIAYSTGYFSQIDFIKAAIPWAVINILVVTLIVSIYWPLIGFGNLPLLGFIR